jgi:hypothetical protein
VCTDDDELVGGDGRPRSSRALTFGWVGSTDGDGVTRPSGRPYSHGRSHPPFNAISILVLVFG